MKIYDFSVNKINGEKINLKDYEGKVLIVVNTASKCGFTPQYEGLENLYKKYNDKGLEIIGVPCNQFLEQEPGSNSDVDNFCKLNYGVTFTLTEKTDVRGENSHPLFNYLTSKAKFKGFDLNKPNGNLLNDILKAKFPEFLIDDSIKWNFTKFLVDREGNVIGRFEPTADPIEMEKDIEKLL